MAYNTFFVPHILFQAAALLGGILPFGIAIYPPFCSCGLTSPLGAAFLELYYVLSSLFASRAYYAFGFLALTAGAIALTTATVTILFVYFLLCAEEYRYLNQIDFQH